MVECVDRLTSPPVKGRFYLVPTVWGRWYGKWKHWPVIGREHTDVEFFNFKLEHYHLDRRFLARADLLVDRYTGTRNAETSPLHGHDEGLPSPVWRRRLCRRSEIGFNYNFTPVRQMQAHFAGVQCKAAATGWICPHRGFPLGSIAPADGVIRFPMHGLQIDAATGLVLAQES